MELKFLNQTICLDLSNDTPYKKKKSLIDVITSHGGRVSFILNKKCSLLVKNAELEIDTYKCRTAFKLGVPVVSVKYITESVDSAEARKMSEYVIKNKQNQDKFKKGKICKTGVATGNSSQDVKPLDPSKLEFIHAEHDQLAQEFDKEYLMAKWIVFHEKSGHNSIIIEIHMSKSVETKYRIRIEIYDRKVSSSVSCRHVYADNSEHALQIYKLQVATYTNERLYYHDRVLPVRNSGSKLLQSISLQSDIKNELKVNKNVGDFIGYIWEEAIGNIEDMFDSDTIKFTHQQIEKAELVLCKQRDDLATSSLETRQDFSSEFYELLPVKVAYRTSIKNRKTIQNMFNLCQLLRDLVDINEAASSFQNNSTIESKYRSLGASIDHVARDTDEHLKVQKMLPATHSTSLKLLNVYKITRPEETLGFDETIGNEQLLFHGSEVKNFVGILSRGLLLPKFLDVNLQSLLLGSGIYFSDDVLTSLKYAPSSQIKNSRLVALCRVALGKCKEYTQPSFGLIKPPDGFNSTHGVKSTQEAVSEFVDSEYVIYNPSQYKIEYILELSDESIDGVLIKNPIFKHNTESREQLAKIDDELTFDFCDNETGSGGGGKSIESGAASNTNSGIVTKDGTSIPLRAVHVRAQLVDMTCSVVIFQEYENNSDEAAIEARYMFPLDDTATVCGFEAFINDKHLVAKCMEKTQARREYKKAIEENKGAYLLEQEKSNVFQVSVGNLPPRSTCCVKINYVAELEIQNEQIVFKLPANVAAWSALTASQLQNKLASSLVTRMTRQNTSFVASILMPFEIRKISSSSHTFRVKRTACQAVCELDRSNINNTSLNENILLQIEIATIHMPRMLVEDHADKTTGTRACMVSFYPEFEAETIKRPRITFLIDCSNSMRNEWFRTAKTILRSCLVDRLPSKCEFNVVAFGSDLKELFPYSVSNTPQNVNKAVNFVQSLQPNMGNTDLLSTIQQFTLLPKSDINLVVISDGYFSREKELVRHLIKNQETYRVFTCGIGESVNSYLLKIVSRVSNGRFYSFEKNEKKLADKVGDMMKKVCEPCALRDVQIEWQNQKTPDGLAKSFDYYQAPLVMRSLFNGERLVAYGFMPNCQQAVLKARLDHDQELSTVVTCAELCITRGTIIHKLTARAIINEWQYGILSEEDKLENELTRLDYKEKIIALSKQFSIASEYTSFLAVEDRETAGDVNSETPSVREIMDNDPDAKSIDSLPYMSYENGPEVMDSEESEEEDESDESTMDDDDEVEWRDEEKPISSSSDSAQLRLLKPCEAIKKKRSSPTDCADSEEEEGGEEDLCSPASDDDGIHYAKFACRMTTEESDSCEGSEEQEEAEEDYDGDAMAVCDVIVADSCSSRNNRKSRDRSRDREREVVSSPAKRASPKVQPQLISEEAKYELDIDSRFHKLMSTADQPNERAAASISKKCQEVEIVLKSNIDRVISRGEALESLELKTQDLDRQSFMFRKSVPEKADLIRKQKQRLPPNLNRSEDYAETSIELESAPSDSFSTNIAPPLRRAAHLMDKRVAMDVNTIATTTSTSTSSISITNSRSIQQQSVPPRQTFASQQAKPSSIVLASAQRSFGDVDCPVPPPPPPMGGSKANTNQLIQQLQMKEKASQPSYAVLASAQRSFGGGVPLPPPPPPPPMGDRFSTGHSINSQPSNAPSMGLFGYVSSATPFAGAASTSQSKQQPPMPPTGSIFSSQPAQPSMPAFGSAQMSGFGGGLFSAGPSSNVSSGGLFGFGSSSMAGDCIKEASVVSPSSFNLNTQASVFVPRGGLFAGAPSSNTQQAAAPPSNSIGGEFVGLGDIFDNSSSISDSGKIFQQQTQQNLNNNNNNNKRLAESGNRFRSSNQPIVPEPVMLSCDSLPSSSTRGAGSRMVEQRRIKTSSASSSSEPARQGFCARVAPRAQKTQPVVDKLLDDSSDQIASNDQLKRVLQSIIQSCEVNRSEIIDHLDVDSAASADMSSFIQLVQSAPEIKPVFSYIEQCGLKSLGAQAEAEVKLMISQLLSLVCLIGLFKPGIKEYKSLSDFETILDNKDNPIEKKILELLESVKRLQAKHAMVCSILELDKSWPEFNFNYMLKCLNTLVVL